MSRWFWIFVFCLLFAVGAFLRVHSYEPFKQVGFDENIYQKYVEYLGKNGFTSWPQLMGSYLDEQEVTPITFLPPTRVTFLFLATAWHKFFGGAAVESVRAISTAASILTLLISPIFAWRIGGRRIAFGVLALMAVAPTQIYMAHRALIDGFFGMVALLVLWSLWETLQKPSSRWWMGFYGISLAFIVLTKENAAFVYLAVLAILLANRWLHFGSITKSLLLATILGPLLGVQVVIVCAGDFSLLVSTYQTNVAKSSQMAYAVATGDGPWFRYLTDLLLVSPLVMIFAIGGIFAIKRKDTASLYFFGFIFVSYFLMTNVRYGMNLRYANMWDFPLRWLALIPLHNWSQSLSSPLRGRILFYGTTALLCLFELANYLRIFVGNEMYDPVTLQLMRALRMLHF